MALDRRFRSLRNYLIKLFILLQYFKEGLRLPAASSVKRIRVDTPIPIALHITSEPVPIFYNVSALGHHQVITMNSVEATQEQYIRRV